MCACDQSPPSQTKGPLSGDVASRGQCVGLCCCVTSNQRLQFFSIFLRVEETLSSDRTHCSSFLFPLTAAAPPPLCFGGC